jgi:hypothetical protein
MHDFITDTSGTIHRTARFSAFERHKSGYLAEGVTAYGDIEEFYFYSWDVERLLRPAWLPCPAGYYTLKPFEGPNGGIEGLVRSPVLGWTATDDNPGFPVPLTFEGIDDSAVLCPDGRVVEFDTAYPSTDEYLDELRRQAATKKAA